MLQTKLGRYNILGELGRGAMGTVYRALDPMIEREVAIKTLHADLPPEVIAEVRERFLREAKAAGRLNHTNIVTIFDVGEQDGVAYMAMEILEGKPLDQILRESTRLPIASVADIIAQIADALDCAQQLGIVHRDVKPANIVVSSSGHAKLTDFGVAFVASSTMTQTGSMIGSPRYMSPEQVLGLAIDPRADIFSLGVLLYEMVSGRAPFMRPEDSTIFPLINRIATELHQPVTQLDPTIPAAFDVILGKAMAKKPEDRYQRAGSMASDLRNLRGLLSSGAHNASDALVDAERTVTLAAGNPSAFEKTAVLPAAENTVVTPPPAAENKLGDLLQDLDKFALNFDAEEQARLAAEEAARRKKAEELQRWDEARKNERKEFERKQAALEGDAGTARGPGPAGSPVPAGAADSGTRRGALDLLRQKTRSSEDEAAIKKAGIDAAIDKSMRLALQYLAEVARELNAVKPDCGRPYDHLYLGRLPAVRLTNAFADLRSRRINDKDHGNHLILRFRVQPVTPATKTVLGADVARFHEYLKSRNIAFEVRDEVMNDFGQPTRGTFTVSAPLPCEVQIQADYDKASIDIELTDVRRPGRVRCRIAPEELGDLVDDLARYVLGVDDDFDKVLKRA